jgi:hypothetical protein
MGRWRIVTLRGDRKRSLNDGQIPHFRGVRVHVSPGYHRAEGNRRASRSCLVSDLHPKPPTTRFANFSITDLLVKPRRRAQLGPWRGACVSTEPPKIKVIMSVFACFREQLYASIILFRTVCTAGSLARPPCTTAGTPPPCRRTRAGWPHPRPSVRPPPRAGLRRPRTPSRSSWWRRTLRALPPVPRATEWLQRAWGSHHGSLILAPQSIPHASARPRRKTLHPNLIPQPSTDPSVGRMLVHHAVCGGSAHRGEGEAVAHAGAVQVHAVRRGGEALSKHVGQLHERIQITCLGVAFFRVI